MKKIIEAAEKCCQPMFARIDEIALENTAKVLDTLQRHEVAARHFAPTTGYGYDDIGRDTLEKLFADLFHADAAIVRPQIASGTHALSMCLFGLLRPGDELLYASGGPYDTLEDVIGVPAGIAARNGRELCRGAHGHGRTAGPCRHPRSHEAVHPRGGRAAQPGLFLAPQPHARGCRPLVGDAQTGFSRRGAHGG